MVQIRSSKTQLSLTQITNKEMELEIISLFIKREKKKRLSGFIEAGKREKMIDALRNPSVFDERFIREFTGAERSYDLLIEQYKKLGMGGRVYMISDNYEWDSQKFQMSYILDECLGAGFDTIGYCWKTQTAFFEWHEIDFSYFMSRKLR